MISLRFPLLRLLASVLLAASMLASHAAAAPILGQGTWQRTLLARDLNNDGITDAYYDTDLKITWLRDFNVNGAKEWGTQMAWADSLTFGGYSDWRLPAAEPTTDRCWNFYCNGEMAHLWYTTLGNSISPADNLRNTGPFQNVLSNIYWYGTAQADFHPELLKWDFNFVTSQQTTDPYNRSFYAVAVRDGDVVLGNINPGGGASRVDEPATWLLLLAALAGWRGLRPARISFGT